MTLHTYKDSSGENDKSLDIFVSSIDQKIEEIKDKGDLEDRRSHKDIVLEQYTICVGFLSDFYNFIPNQYWEKDGIGACIISEPHSEEGIQGPFAEEIIKIRTLMKPQRVDWAHKACIFHAKNIGCILGEYKSPLCVAFPDGDLPEIYSEKKFREFFNTILLAGGSESENFCNTNPQKNWPVVISFLKEVKKNSLALKTQ